MISIIPLPYKILALLLLILGAAALGYNRGYSHGTTKIQQKWDSEKVTIANNTIKAVEQAQAQAQKDRLQLVEQGQEAVKQAAEEMAKAKQDAAAWERRYRQALQTPECEKWSKELVQCPLR